MNLIKNDSALPQKYDGVDSYILGTLLYTPLFYIERCIPYVEIKVYAPDKDYPAMKIFRMLFQCCPVPGYPDNLVEVAFQDEVSIKRDDEIDFNERWQINFSIDTDKETLQYKSIRDRPKSLLHLADSMQVFSDLSRQSGARLYAGDWRFESDGNGWQPEGVQNVLRKAVLQELPTM